MKCKECENMEKVSEYCTCKKDHHLVGLNEECQDRIFCLVGPSGTGKTTISKVLWSEGYNVIQSYTTRPARSLNEWGHIFTKEEALINFTSKEDLIAYTYYDKHHYWATREQYQGKGNTIYVIDPKGVKTLKEKVKDADIKVIYLTASVITRIARMQLDKRTNICDRLDVDKLAFKNVDHDIIIDTNAPLPTVVDKVKEYIEGVK